MQSPLRLHKATGTDRIVSVSVQPAWAHEGMWIIQVAKGPELAKLAQSALYGPFPTAQLDDQIQKVVVALRAEGYEGRADTELHTLLKNANPRVVARAAWRLAWRRQGHGVSWLLEVFQSATDARCSLVDALGELRDPAALPVLRDEAQRKLLSRRRSGFEALLKFPLDEAERLALRNASYERLPASLQPVVGPLVGFGPASTSDTGLAGALTKPLDALSALLKQVPLKDRGLACDTLYEFRHPTCTEALLRSFEQDGLSAPWIWRYAKSVWKRALLRHDGPTLARLYLAIERASRLYKGTAAELKSGYDGTQKQVRVFHRSTVNWLRRAQWRWLKEIARNRPDEYAFIAAELLAQYGAHDGGKIHRQYGAYASCYLLHRVFFGASSRFEFLPREVRFRYKKGVSTSVKPGTREESFPALWDAQPRAYLRVLARAELPFVQQWALEAVRVRHPKVLQSATAQELSDLLASAHPDMVHLALQELERRFEPAKPDWDLLEKLLSDGRAPVRELGLAWLLRCTSVWEAQLPRLLKLLSVPDPEARLRVSAVLAKALVAGELGASVRGAFADAVVSALRQPETLPGVHAAYAELGREALTDELTSRLTLSEAVTWIASGSPGAKSVAAAVLAKLPGILEQLGLTRVLELANHELATVRLGAHRILSQATSEASLKAQPEPLILLSESDWADTRRFALEYLRTRIGLEALGAEGVLGLCDSNRGDVQALGRELVVKFFQQLDPQELLKKLTEHPAHSMRLFALDLVLGYLKPGFVQLAKLEDFFRTILLELWPSRAAKRKVIVFLTERGLADENQAEVSARVLDSVLRTHSTQDFELILQALVRIKLVYPGVTVGFKLQEQQAGGLAP